jgi:hypothetical protein
MNTQSASLSKAAEPPANHPGEGSSKPGDNPAILSTILKVTKTRALFLHFEIGFKRTAPTHSSFAADLPAGLAADLPAPAPQSEQVVAQPVLAFSAAAPRQPPPALAGGVAAGGGSGSSTSGSAVYVCLKGGTTVTPPDGYPPPK